MIAAGATDEVFMAEALRLAREGGALGEVPVAIPGPKIDRPISDSAPRTSAYICVTKLCRPMCRISKLVLMQSKSVPAANWA